MRAEGKRFGDYRVLGEIARGGQGAVVRAVREADGQPVAIKLLLDKAPQRVARFRQEARVLAKLSHPNLIRVLDDGENDGLPYIVMELVEGEELGDLAGDQPLDPGEAVLLFGAIAGALGHCHDHGVVHRDVKPANIIVEAGTRRPVLVDFGLVKRDPDRLSVGSLGVSRLSRTGELRGTPTFMAPEQISPASYGEVSPATDVYALGATLFAVLTGEPPFTADHLPGILAAILSEPIPDARSRNPDVPAGLARFCKRCLSKAPADRPPSAQAFAEELALALEGGPRRSRGGLGVAIALGLVVLALGLAFALRGEDPATASTPAEPAAPSQGTEPSVRPLSAEDVARGDRELRRLERKQDPREIAEGSAAWLERFAGHPKAGDVRAQLEAARLRFPVRLLPGLRGQFLDDERVIAYSKELGSGVGLWNLEGEKLRGWPIEWPVSALAVHPSRRAVAVGGWGGEVLVVDVASGEITLRVSYAREVSALAFSPDGALLAVGGCELTPRSNGTYLRSDFDGRLLDGVSGETRTVLEKVRAEVKAFAFTSAGLLVARGSNLMDPKTNLTQADQVGNALALHDPATGVLLHEQMLTTRPNFLALHPDGRVLTGTNGGRLLLCDPSGEIVRHYTADDVSFNRTGPRFLVSAQGNAVRGAVFLSGGAQFCTTGGEGAPAFGEVSLWDTATGERLRKVTLEADQSMLSASPNGRWLLIRSLEGLSLWRAR